MINFAPSPQLVTIEGESFLGGDPGEVAELLGIDYPDAQLLTDNSRLSPRQVAYLNYKYPEYMGIWPIIAKIGTAVGGLIVKGVKAVKKKGDAKKTEKFKTALTGIVEKAKAAVAKKKEAAAAVIAAEEKKEAKSSQQKTMLMTMLPIAAIAALMLLKK